MLRIYGVSRRCFGCRDRCFGMRLPHLDKNAELVVKFVLGWRFFFIC